MRVSGGSMRSDFSCRVMEDLQLTCPNLNNCTTETLTKLDVDAFLYASAFCAGATLEEQLRAGLWGSDRPPTLPASITQQLCTGPQAKWWSAVHQIYMRQTSGDNAGELRLTIQRGLEVIRVNGNHGLDVKLLVLLARVFHYRASTKTSIFRYHGRSYLGNIRPGMPNFLPTEVHMSSWGGQRVRE
ncbi:unnamed protein product [Timema podura]|uniref:Uncharacterized protein n=1 Tax=Timema podura TaxID=61482 RepID=A0ABN7PMJ1_TIMPD|nr:unnamed protein product [Timema podura]